MAHKHIKVGDDSLCQAEIPFPMMERMLDAGVFPCCTPGGARIDAHAAELRSFGLDARVVDGPCDQQAEYFGGDE